MPGRRSAKAREQGLERTDNEFAFTSWPAVSQINQKNYYTDYLKRDDQILVLRLQNEDNRNRMTKQARDKDRALAQGGPDVDMDDDNAAEDNTGGNEEFDAKGTKTIIIHPGSQNLRIGFASDILPKTVPMVVARKSTECEAEMYGDDVLPRRQEPEEDEPREGSVLFGDEFAGQYTIMINDLKTRMRKKGRRIVPNSREVAMSFNRKVQPSFVSEHNDVSGIEWTDPAADAREQGSAPIYYTGQAALRIPDNSTPRYKLFWPLRFGHFNEADYSNKPDLYNDFALILHDAMRTQLGLNKTGEWSQYSCVFVVPDLYERTYMTYVLDLFLREFGFGRICFVQESVMGAFGAGQQSCVIVDVGAQKTSICCVEDGMCIENSRINLKYGASDVTEMFIKILLFDQFPYADINLRRRHDLHLAEELKQNNCTLSVQDFITQQYEFYLRVYGEDTRHYLFKAYDEVMLAPMTFFRPQMFDTTDKAKDRRKLIARSSDLYDGSPNDPVSAAQNQVIAISPKLDFEESPEDMMETSTSRAQPSDAKANGKANGESLGETEVKPSFQGSPGEDDKGTPQPAREGTPMPGDKDNQGPTTHPLTELVRAADDRDRTVPTMPLHEAVALSIEHGSKGDDKKMRDFFGSILPVGGGALTPFFKDFLEDEIKELPVKSKKIDIMVAPAPRDIDPQVLIWKGASVFGKLQTNDSWISGFEYDRQGSRTLNYKCIWNY